MRASGAWRALAAARRANLAAAGEPAPVPGGEGETRRAVLKALAASAFVAGLPRPARAASGGPVAIVGGGLAGLSALWRLTQAGVDAHLYEARPRLGGRVHTLRVPGREPLELGGQLVNTDHVDMHALARAFGVGLIDRKAGAHRTLLLDGARAIPEAEAIAALRPIAAVLTADSDRLDRDLAGVGAELDRLSFTSYLDRHRDALPAPWVRSLLEQTARTEYGAEPGDASAIELMFNLPSVAGARVDVLAKSDERWLIAGGSGALVAEMAARLAGRISVGRAVIGIDPARAGVRLAFADGSHAIAAAVIVATPAGVTRRIRFGVPLPPLWRRFIAEGRLGRNEKVQAITDGRPWEAAIGRGGELWRSDAGPVALGWDGAVRPDGSGLWTWFLGGEQVDEAAAGDALAQARAFARAAASGLPGLEAASRAAMRTAWHRDPLTAGSYINYRPGQMTLFAPLIWTEGGGPAPLPAGPIHFAGEHVSDAYPGYMNGAAQTGRLAAETVIASLTA